MVTIGSGGGHGCSSFYDKFLGLTQIKFHQILLSPEFSTSSEALSLKLGPAGVLHVMSSAYLVIKVLWEAGLLSLTMIVKEVQVPEQCLGAHLDWQARMGLWLCLHIPFADDILKSQ